MEMIGVSVELGGVAQVLVAELAVGQSFGAISTSGDGQVIAAVGGCKKIIW